MQTLPQELQQHHYPDLQTSKHLEGGLEQLLNLLPLKVTHKPGESSECKTNEEFMTSNLEHSEKSPVEFKFGGK